MTSFGTALVAWAAGDPGETEAAAAAHRSAARAGLRTVVLVEGASDRAAVQALAARRDRDLAAEGVSVVPMGGATSIGRFLRLLGPDELDVAVAGLCDAGEAGYFRRSLEHAGRGRELGTDQDLGPLGFFVCVADLEEELIRSLGVAGVEAVIDAEGDLRTLRTFQNQPAQRPRTVEQQLRRFMGTLSGRKIHYAAALVAALDPGRVPQPLDRLLSHV